MDSKEARSAGRFARTGGDPKRRVFEPHGRRHRRPEPPEACGPWGARPRDGSEEELAGYRRALDWIFRSKTGTEITPKVVLKLHSLAQGGHSGDAGEWKQKDNEIIEIQPDGRRRIRFRPTPAKDTPAAIAALCDAYRRLQDEDRVPSLIVIATFVFDFLCIHPFRDGNGRVSRLLTTLLLKSHGFDLVRYTSLERLVEERKDEYYGVLEACSTGWHDASNEIVPWWNLFLSVLRSGYRDLEQRMSLSESPRAAKTDLVRQGILEQISSFTLGDLMLQFPAASPQLIKKVLGQLKNEGKVRLDGRGRGATWRIA
ncbi:MAG: Fic family protein [Acidobacteria bacterium]|nr:Fic family protein [Acidobacteriota bacterium]